MALICYWAEVTVVSMVIGSLERGLDPNLVRVAGVGNKECHCFEEPPNRRLIPAQSELQSWNAA